MSVFNMRASCIITTVSHPSWSIQTDMLLQLFDAFESKIVVAELYQCSENYVDVSKWGNEVTILVYSWVTKKWNEWLHFYYTAVTNSQEIFPPIHIQLFTFFTLHKLDLRMRSARVHLLIWPILWIKIFKKYK